MRIVVVTMKLAFMETNAYIRKGDYRATDPQTGEFVAKYFQGKYDLYGEDR